MKAFILYFFASVCIFLAPIQGLMIAVGFAIILDTFFGIYRSVKVKGWKFITSRRLSEIVSKMLLYELCMICLYVIDFFLLSEISNKFFSIEFMATKITAMLLIFIESVSIKENFEKATGLDVWALLKSALGRAKEVKDSINDIVEK
jgi:hypothetical protein